MSLRAYYRKDRNLRAARALAERAIAVEGNSPYAEALDDSPIVRRAERHAREPLDLGGGLSVSPDAWRNSDDRDAG